MVGYYTTETGPLIATSEVKRLLEDDQTRYDIKKRQGIPMLGMEIRVVDEDGNEVPWDDATIGEILTAKLTDCYRSGLSVIRQGASDDDILGTIGALLAAEGNDGLVGAVVLPAERIREIGEEAKQLANPQQAAFRTQFTRQAIPLRPANCPEQHRIGGQGQLLCGFREGATGGIDGTATELRLFQLKAEIQGFQDTHGLRHDFNTDAITGQYADFHSFPCLKAVKGER